MFKTACFLLGLLILFSIIYLAVKKLFYSRQLSAGQKALKALEALKKKQIQTRQDAHEAYFAITDILKRFFQVHYGKPFERMTDQEMIESLKKTDFPADLQISSLSDMIQQA